MSALPSAGPIIITVPGLTDVSIAAQVGAVPGTSPAVRFTWARPYVVSAFWLNCRSADLIQLAGLGLRIVDENQNELFADGFGATQNFFGLGLSLVGRSPRWQPFRRVVRAGTKWTLQMQNRGTVPVVPWLGFKVEMQNNG